jgi:PKD repeat protein
MKKKLIFICSIILITICLQGNAQNLILSVTGHVYDISTGLPINNQNITLNISGNGLWNSYLFQSDFQGYWGSDSLPGYNQGIVHAISYDCLGQIHEFQENYSPESTTFIFDFYICKDSIQAGDCENWFWFELSNNTTFQFHGESLPYPAELYHWDFGDGQTGTGQDIFHTFDPLQDSIYLVQLTTILINPVTNDSCLALSEQLITINNISDCEAAFICLPDTIEPFVYYFYDNSTGNITDWLWDFGDGTTSNETNPVHSFAGPGIYNICLTIAADSLGLYCSDIYCQELTLNGALIADFSLVLDTISGLPRNYFFKDNSSGAPQLWLWDFGDGTNSTQQNPVYKYAQSGAYEVCLQVTKFLPNGGSQSDSYCEEIWVPEYYDIGGLAFAGNTPINNPYSTGDTGVAYLYRKYNDALVTVDTNYFYEFGYYWFPEVREGNHLVKVGLTENSENFSFFAPAYYQQQLHWKDAEILQVYDSNNYYANVYLAELPGTTAGAGAVYGNIIDMQNPSLSDYVNDQPVLLYNENNELLTFQLSNIMGSFTFENLAFGTYKLYAEVTGFSGSPFTVTIDEINPIYYNALLEIYEGDPNDIGENNFTGIQTGIIYPNPLTDNLNLDLVADQDLNLFVTIYDLLGQKISEHNLMIQSGSEKLTLSTEQLESGLYFIAIRTNMNLKVVTCKFFKK